jgi:small subunit ribosomal protein S8
MKMLNDTLANALSQILNSEKAGKSTCSIKPISKTVKAVLKLLREHHYIGSFKDVADGRGDHTTIQLIGRINKCGAIRPRFSVKTADFEKFEKRFLPAKDFGIIIVSTPQGIMTHNEAKNRNIGGRLLAYCY